MGVECRVRPEVVVFTSAEPGSEIGEIEVVGGHGAVVTRAESSLPDLLTRVEAHPEDPGSLVRLFVAPDAEAGRKTGRITLHVREGALDETREVMFYGTVEWS